MPLYIGDYLADTGHLSTTQHGAYLLLMMHYWRKSGLPDDDKQLAAIAKLPLRIWLDTKETIQAFFHDGWRHNRIDAELEKRARVSKDRASAGKKGGESRGKKEASASVLLEQNPSMLQSQSQIDDDADDAGAREPSRGASGKQAYDLAEQLLEIAGHSRHVWPPGWCGAPLRVKMWIEQGWKVEIIIAAVRSAAQRKRGPPAESIQYFEKAIAEEHARQAAPVPKVEIRQAETITVTHGTSKPRSGGSLLDAIKRERASVEAQIADLEMSGNAVLSIPDRSVRRS